MVAARANMPHGTKSVERQICRSYTIRSVYVLFSNTWGARLAAQREERAFHGPTKWKWLRMDEARREPDCRDEDRPLQDRTPRRPRYWRWRLFSTRLGRAGVGSLWDHRASARAL